METGNDDKTYRDRQRKHRCGQSHFAFQRQVIDDTQYAVEKRNQYGLDPGKIPVRFIQRYLYMTIELVR